MISEADLELYDRQIRVWGVDAQQRLRNARVLVAGVDGAAAELCKNLVLAGIGSLTLCDEHAATPHDLQANFFLAANPDAVGANRAAASRDRALALNPNVGEFVFVCESTTSFCVM
jgi:ubiquitin-like 1-activating enzyme E1 A